MIRSASDRKTQSNAAAQFALTRNFIQPAQFFWKHIEWLKYEITESPCCSLTTGQSLRGSNSTELREN